MRSHHLFLCLCLLTVTCCLLAAPTEEEIAAPQPQGGAPAPMAGMLGPQSCMATACHGKSTFREETGSQLVFGAEYTFSRDFDPHARAAETLHGDLSKRMIAALDIKPNEVARHCGVCHDPGSLTPTASLTAGQGVTCESCHGAAQSWRNSHFRPFVANNKTSPPGMANTKSLSVRADVCAGCHVGDATRQVGHDLIAAGHPAMKFELASYHARLPKHWNEPADRGRSPNFETLLWAHGQHAQLKESVRQLGQPVDFAHYDCYACHHDLVPDSWRQDAPQAGLGKLAWNPWGHALAPAALGQADARIKALADQVREDRQAAAQEAGRLGDYLAGLSIPQSSPRGVLRALQARLQDPSLDWNWDTAAQAYLAIVAVFQDLSLAPALQSDMVEQLNAVRQQLRFPQQQRPPQAPVQFGSPRNFDTTRDGLRAVLQSVVARLLSS